MIIVSDTSPLSALAEIGSPDLLHLIFGQIGIIGEAAKLKILDFDEAVERVKAIGFHVADDVIQTVRQRIGS